MSIFTEQELISLESCARHGDKVIDGIKEICSRIDPALSLEVARNLYVWASESEIIELAIKVLEVHKDHAPGELAARSNLSKEDTGRVIDALSKPQAPASFDSWSSSAARKWLMSYAKSLSRVARYIRENADGFAENEDEFRRGLANGLGIDDEEEQTEIIAKFLAKGV